MSSETNWIPALIAAGVGLGMGLLGAWRLRRTASHTHQLDQRDAQAEWLNISEQLQAAKAQETTDPEVAHHRYALELRAARHLMEQAMNESLPEPTEPTDAVQHTSGNTRKAGQMGALWGALAMAAILVPILLVQNHATERGEGGSITGNTGPAGGPTPKDSKAPQDPYMASLVAAVKAQPQAIEPKLRLTRALIGNRRFIQAYEQADAILKLQPDHAQGMTFLAIVRIEMGMASKAVELLSKAIAKDPSLVEAWIYRGVASMQAGEAQAALDDWQEAIGIRPDAKSVLEPMMKRAQGILSGAIEAPKARPHPSMGQGAAGARPPGHPRHMGTAATKAPSIAPGKPARVTIKLAAGAEAKKGEILFIIGRAAGVKAGPPAAVKRLTVNTFPVDVRLNAQDSMMGQPLPKVLDITARVDGDGNPLTKNDGVRGTANGVSVGGDAATLTLAPQKP